MLMRPLTMRMRPFTMPMCPLTMPMHPLTMPMCPLTMPMCPLTMPMCPLTIDIGVKTNVETLHVTRTYAKNLSNSHSSVLRQLLQVGEPAQRTGFSVSLWFVVS